jgi:hypothetical protein
MDIEIKREEEWCKVGGGEEGVWEMKECLERENINLEKTKKDSNAPQTQKKLCRQQRMNVSESKHSTIMEDCSNRAELMV